MFDLMAVLLLMLSMLAVFAVLIGIENQIEKRQQRKSRERARQGA